MNAAVVFTIHGNIDEINRKVGGDLKRVSEFLVIKKYCERFGKVFVFTDDKKNCSNLLPENCFHVRLFNPFVYVIFGWLVLLYFTIRYKIKLIHLVGSPAIPLVFMINKLTPAKTLLEYNYLWHSAYFHDPGMGLKSKITRNELMGKTIKTVERFFVNRFIDCFVLGTKEANSMIENRNKILPVKKGIILENFDPGKTRAHPVYKKIKGKTVLFAGRLVKMKDPITLIKAYKIAKEKIKNLNLIICGVGELEDECKKIADKNVVFMGNVSNIAGMLKGCDIYVQPSAYDPSPRALLEAMAMGKPCIATKVGGVEEYLEGCGILVPPKNPEVLAEKIIFLFKNPKLMKEFGKKARKRIVESHDLERNIEKVLKLLNLRI
ncbi:MAG: hypothetical protein DRP13_01070 [Candidatus Aenigmatarchaeota archaeon]|nr:MAG: hypothetical protein DRP13_01070 [Candidatus Aenigmarchaeota archaeon]